MRLHDAPTNLSREVVLTPPLLRHVFLVRPPRVARRRMYCLAESPTRHIRLGPALLLPLVAAPVLAQDSTASYYAYAAPLHQAEQSSPRADLSQLPARLTALHAPSDLDFTPPGAGGPRPAPSHTRGVSGATGQTRCLTIE